MFNKFQLFISKFWFKISFIVLGLASLIWFLVRVIPKPSRAQYPCMKAAAPLASSFITYIMGLSIFAFVLRKAKQRFSQSKYVAALGFIMIGLFAGTWAIFNNSDKAVASVLADDQPVNQPIGDAKGLFPGRVVWVHNTEATNENCTNGNNDFWSLEKNTNQAVVSNMLSASIQQLTGKASDAEAWNAIFHYYNSNNGRGDVGYTPGEQIMIKINLNGLNGNAPQQKNINTSPQICYAILNQLVNIVGVAESDIFIGDPGTSMSSVTYNKCHDVFENVNYVGRGSGQLRVTTDSEKGFHYSDGISKAISLPKEFVDATYLINIPVFKKHHRAGISICCKNHVGTINNFSGQNYSNGDWHESLIAPLGQGIITNNEYGVYRCFVDFMGHKDLGGKTILYLVDGIWGSVNWGHPAVKFRMQPFNNDWPNSLFTSLDPVAIESVCYDFLYNEFDENHPTEGGEIDDNKGPFPRMGAVDDYLHQASDTKNWPAGIQYDPEGDGTVLKSMGTHEHWNNAIDMKYSRDLSASGKGIELYRAGISSSRTLKDYRDAACSNYPNPFNNSTTIRFKLDMPSSVIVNVYDLQGRMISSVNLNRLNTGEQNYEWNAVNNLGKAIPSGNYIYKLEIENKTGKYQLSNKMTIIK